MSNDQESLWDALFGPTPAQKTLYGYTATRTSAASPNAKAPTLVEMKAAADRLEALNIRQPEPVELTREQWEALKAQCRPQMGYPAPAGAPSHLFGLRIVLKDG